MPFWTLNEADVMSQRTLLSFGLFWIQSFQVSATAYLYLNPNPYIWNTKQTQMVAWLTL